MGKTLNSQKLGQMREALKTQIYSKNVVLEDEEAQFETMLIKHKSTEHIMHKFSKENDSQAENIASQNLETNPTA